MDGVVESPLSMGLMGGGVNIGMGPPPTTTLKSQSLPRAATPIYSQHQIVCASWIQVLINFSLNKCTKILTITIC